MSKIKCRKIKYDAEGNDGNTLKRTATVEVSDDMIEILSVDDDFADALDEIRDYLIDEISETVGCPVLDLEWEFL